jgi:hypothetical protein
MIELATGPTLVNGLGFNAVCKESLVYSLCQTIVDLHTGNPVKLSTDFKINPDVNLSNDMSIEGTKGYMRLEIEDTIYEYVVLEFPSLIGTKNDFSVLRDHIKSFVPELYKTQVGLALTPAVFNSLFNYRGLILFCFENDELIQMSTLPKYNSYYNDYIAIEKYVKQLSLYTANMSKDREKNLNALLTGPIATNLNGSNGQQNDYVSYYNNNYQDTFEFVLFAKLGYLRVNGIQIKGNDFSLLMERDQTGGTYKSNEQFANLITALILPNAPASTHFSKAYFGQHLFKMDGGINPPTTRAVFPLVVDKYPGFTDYIPITLSQDDEEFLKQVNEVSETTVYSKHKLFVVSHAAPITRGCKALINASGTLKVLVREDKKKLSDEEAYKNRIFRDYLSHAISLVCIPIFQKEFVIPEYLQKSFEFNMATLTSTYYLPHKQYGKPRHTDRYKEVFQNKVADPNWTTPMILTDLPVVPHQVKDFIDELKARTLSSSTQSRSSIFTRYFVKPYMEASVNSYTMINTPAPFGWMYDIDDQMAHSWSPKMTSAHLLRSSTPRGRFYANCGLMTDKTFGIKSIMNHVFCKTDFTGINEHYCISAPDQFVPQDKKAQFISAVNEIYTANFVPNDKVEAALASFGREDYFEHKAMINQILFIQEDSLTILKSLYNCKSFEDLAVALDFVMPMCLEIVETLNYSPELKNHVSKMLKYFWDITTAISEELTPNESAD